MDPIRSFILPEEAKELNEEAAKKYFETLLSTCSFIKQEVIDKIENAIISRSQYNDNSQPDKMEEENFGFGGLEITLVTIPTEKKPSYSEIYKKILDYAYFLREDFNDGNLHQSLVPIDKKPYVSLDMLVKRIRKLKGKSEGVRQEFHYKEPEKIPQKIVVPVADYEQLPPEAEIYAEAKKFFEEAAVRGKKTFENLLGKYAQGSIADKSRKKEEKLPEKKEEKEAKIEAWKSVGDYLFRTVIGTPPVTISYAGIYNALVKEDKKLERCGELILLQKGLEEKMPKMIVNAYDPRTKNKTRFVSLNGFERRVFKIYLENSSIKEEGKILVQGFPSP